MKFQLNHHYKQSNACRTVFQKREEEEDLRILDASIVEDKVSSKTIVIKADFHDSGWEFEVETEEEEDSPEKKKGLPRLSEPAMAIEDIVKAEYSVDSETGEHFDDDPLAI